MLAIQSKEEHTDLLIMNEKHEQLSADQCAIYFIFIQKTKSVTQVTNR